MSEIERKEKELPFLNEKRDLGQGQNAVSIANRIKEVRQERDMSRTVLKRKQDNQKSVQKMRRWKKEALSLIVQTAQGPSQSGKGNAGDDNDSKNCLIESDYGGDDDDDDDDDDLFSHR